MQRAVDAHPGIARFTVALDRPVIGLGASAPLHYAGLPPLVGNECVVPEDTDVANALGAVVGQVRVSAEARVSQPKEGLFRLSSGETVRDFIDEAAAIAAAEADVRAIAAERATDAGTDNAEIDGEPRVPCFDRRGPAHVHRGACGGGGLGKATNCRLKRIGRVSRGTNASMGLSPN